MKNTFGMPLVVCTENFSVEIKYNNYSRTQEYVKNTTYSWTKIVECFNRNIIEKAGMYNEKGTKGLCTITKEMLEKYFIDLDNSLIEVNNIFENIMDNNDD